MLNISVTPNPSVTSVTKPADPPAISPELAHALTGLLTSGIDKHKNHIRNLNRTCKESKRKRQGGGNVNTKGDDNKTEVTAAVRRRHVHGGAKWNVERKGQADVS